jgi:Cu/Ag efflux protein CusF
MKAAVAFATLAALAAPQAVAQAPSATLADGEVRKIDKDAGKITLKHGPIKSLDMPPMTMVFQVKDRALLDKVKSGDKVRFAAEEKAGAYVVTAIEAAK